MRPLLARLVAHVRWADARTAASLRVLHDPPADAVRLFAHVARAEGGRLAHVRGERTDPHFGPDLPLDEAAVEAARAADGLEALLGDPREDLTRPVRYRNSAGHTFETPVWEIVTNSPCTGSTTGARSPGSSARPAVSPPPRTS